MKQKQIQRAEQVYALLLQLYPTPFRQQFAEEMKFVFSESLQNAGEQQGSKGILILLGWTLVDLSTSLFNEHLAERKARRSMNSSNDLNGRHSVDTFQKLGQKSGALASFLLAVVFIIPEYIYLTGTLSAVNGPLAYSLADFLYGPVRAACLVAAIYALTERIGDRSPRRNSVVLLAAMITAGMFVTAALLRSSNRNYHLMHPELNLEMSASVLTVWATVVGGVIATGWHFLGWSLLLLGSAGWTSGRLPRALCVLYWVVGTLSLFVYLQPEIEGGVVLLGMIMCIWQGIVLWRSDSQATPPQETPPSMLTPKPA